jgi:lipoprotein NlpI
MAKVNDGLARANRMLPRAVADEEKAEVLFRRGQLYILGKQSSAGCVDLRQARQLTQRTLLQRQIAVYFDANAFDDPCK